MPTGEEAYRRQGLHTEIYDAMHDPSEAALAGDVDFYRAVAVLSGRPVLDLGCGTGRVSLPLARHGLEVVGLDRSEAMLGRAAARLARESTAVRSRCRFVLGDMADFDLGRTFGTIVIPFRSFQMLLSPGEQRSCLAAARRHLDRDGRLVVDLFDPDLSLFALEAWGGVELDWEGSHPASGNRVTVEIIGRRNDRVHQTFLQRLRFTEFDATGGEIRREEESLRLRWIYRYEFHYLLELSGFVVEAEYSDFFRAPPVYGGELIYVARPRG